MEIGYQNKKKNLRKQRWDKKLLPTENNNKTV